MLPRGNYRVGDGSDFDVDMTLIESFIMAKEDRDNYLVQLSVFDYYKSRILAYWNFFESNIADHNEESRRNLFWISNSDKVRRELIRNDVNEAKDKRAKKYGISASTMKERVNNELSRNKRFTNMEDAYQSLFPLDEEDLQKMIRFRPYEEDISTFPEEMDFMEAQMTRKIASVFQGAELRFIKDNVDFYRDRLILLLNETSRIFEKKNHLKMDHIAYLFSFVGGLACLNPYNEGTSINRGDNKLQIEAKGEVLEFRAFLFPNDDGLFGFNTYLRAYFSGILLVGVPNRVQSYDDQRGCPLDFMAHDYTHNYNMIGAIVKVKRVSFLKYYRTFQDIYMEIHKSIEDKMMKEMLLLTIWIIIHELTNANITAILFDKKRYALRVINSRLPFVDEFQSLFNSYAPILDEQESLELVSDFIDSDEDLRAGYDLEIQQKPDKYYYCQTMLYSYIRIMALVGINF